MKTILIIDDNIELRENTAEILELAGYRVITADDGKTGLNAAISYKPNLIICDLALPEMKGLGLLQKMRGNITTRKIPFIIVTSRSENFEKAKYYKPDADTYLIKPYDAVELKKTVAEKSNQRTD